MQRIWRLSKKTGELRLYEYAPKDYRIDAAEQCRRSLERRPLVLVRKKSGGTRWRSGKRGRVFNDATVAKLIDRGVAVCLGEFVELKGKTR